MSYHSATSILIASLLLGCSSVRAESLPSETASVIETAEARALAIYRHDRAAAIATDAALKLRSFKKDKRVDGWITEERNAEIFVTFIDKSPAALYRAIVSSTEALVGEVGAFEQPLPLSNYERDAAAARSAALSSSFEPCSSKYNTVVLPADEGEATTWIVYLLPGTTKKNVVPIGGTYRFEVDGSTVVSQRGFTRTCVALQNDSRAVALMITHLMDPIPTEAHVFWSLWARKAMYVATQPGGALWAIESGKIRLVKSDQAG